MTNCVFELRRVIHPGLHRSMVVAIACAWTAATPAAADMYSERIAVVSQLVATTRSLSSEALIQTTIWWNVESRQIAVTNLGVGIEDCLNPVVGDAFLHVLWRRAGMLSNGCEGVFCERGAQITESNATEQVVHICAWDELYSRSPTNAWAYFTGSVNRVVSLGDMCIAGRLLSDYEVWLIPSNSSDSGSSQFPRLKSGADWIPADWPLTNWQTLANGQNVACRFISWSAADSWTPTQSIVSAWSNMLYDTSWHIRGLGASILIDRVPAGVRGVMLSNYMSYARASCGTNVFAWSIYKKIVEEVSEKRFWGEYPVPTDPDMPHFPW